MLEENLPLVLAIGAVVAGAIIAAGAQQPILFFYAAIFSTAILKTPELPGVREKFALTEVFMILTWLFWSRLPRVRRSLPSSGVVIPLGFAFIVVCTASALIGLATLGNPSLDKTRLYAGVFIETANYAYGVMIVLTAIQVIDRWERLTGAVFAWLLGMLVASSVGTLAFIGLAPGWVYEEGTRRINSTLRNENQVPSMILPLILIPIMTATYRRLGGVPRAIMFATTGFAFLTALGTGSRTAVLMLILAAASLALLASRDLRVRSLLNVGQLRTFAMVFMIAVCGYFVAAWSAYDGKYSLMKTPAWQRPAAMLIESFQGGRNLDENRPKQIRAALGHFVKSPIFGTGPKLGVYSAETHGEVHNTYFSLLLETGLAGLLLHLGLLFQAGQKGWNAATRCRYDWYRMLGRGLFVGLLLLILYNNTILGLRQRNIWFLIGFLFAYSNLVLLNVPPPRSLRLPRPLRPWRPFFIDSSGFPPRALPPPRPPRPAPAPPTAVRPNSR